MVKWFRNMSAEDSRALIVVLLGANLLLNLLGIFFEF